MVATDYPVAASHARRLSSAYGKRAWNRRPGTAPARRPVLDLVIDFDGLASLRNSVAAHAAELGAGEVGDDIVLVAHELATNVVRHGGGTGWLCMWRSGERIICRVSDGGPGLRDPKPPAADRLRPGGRGLEIARQLADVRIETGPTGTVVVAALAVQQNEEPDPKFSSSPRRIRF